MEEEETNNIIIMENENENQDSHPINIEENNENHETNEIIELKKQDEKNEIKINEDLSNSNNIIIENNENNIIIEDNKININQEDQKQNENEDLDDNLSLINIDVEKEKNEINTIQQKMKEKLEDELEKNMNKINIEEEPQEPQEPQEKKDNIEDQNPENLNVDDYLFNEDESENYKYNKEYIDDDEDLHSKRLTARNNNEEYLMLEKDNDEENNKDVLGEYKQEDDNDDEEEELFPFRMVGDAKKKSNLLGEYNYRYLELDAVKGLFKRYYSSKEYPKKPKEIIDIKNFKLLKKLKVIKEFYDLEITYIKTNKKGKKTQYIENYRFRHQECRNKWFDSLLLIWKSLVKGIPVKITKNILSFVDDRLGIVQEIGRGNKHNKNKKKPKIDFKKFKILSLLGVGGFGTVFKVRHILTDKIYAMKVMNKNYIIQKKYLHYVVSEFEIMKSLGGFPFVLDLHYCFQTANFLYLIIDYCPNGDFTKLLSVNNPKLFFAEMVLAFEYIHNKGIIYRDLKPENILLDDTGHIKICDFNLAKAGMTKNKRADSFCGSPLYFSPEMVLNQGVNFTCDIYGIGLIMYEIIVGYTAYDANNIQELYEKIKKNKINFNVPQLKGDAKDLIMKMCAKNPDDRISLEDAKKHRYFKDIDFDKVLNKEYGRIETVKRDKKKRKKDALLEKMSPKEREDFERKRFLEHQRELDEDETLNVTNGKITLKEMMLDQPRHMKNRVRAFYYVKKEDIEQTEEFKLEVNGNQDITALIMDQYNA